MCQHKERKGTQKPIFHLLKSEQNYNESENEKLTLKVITKLC